MRHKDNNALVNFVLAFCLFCFVFGCSNTDRSTDSAPAATETIEHWKLLSEFNENEVSANERYKGKRLRVTGAVDFVTVERGKIMARFSVPASSYTQLFAEFPESQKEAAGSIKSKQQVVVECTCLGITSIGRVEINDCILKAVLK